MDNNTTMMDVLLDKKMDAYGFRSKNFLAHGELTVTITLAEYRELVENDAKAQQRIDDAEKGKYERTRKIESLEDENTKLKSELYALQKRFGIFDETLDDDEE